MKRLVALAIEGSWEGDWQTAHGNEQAVVAYPIGQGERVTLEGVDIEGSLFELLLSSQQVVIDGLQLARYRIVKDSSNAIESRPTTVELILSNGGRR